MCTWTIYCLKKKKKAPLHEGVFESLMSFGMCKYQAGESMGKKNQQRQPVSERVFGGVLLHFGGNCSCFLRNQKTQYALSGEVT